MMKKIIFCSICNFPIVINLSHTGSTFSQEKILHLFSVKARPFKITGNDYFIFYFAEKYVLKDDKNFFKSKFNNNNNNISTTTKSQPKVTFDPYFRRWHGRGICVEVKNKFPDKRHIWRQSLNAKGA